MNDSRVGAYLVRDISPNLQSGAWRWGFKHPEMRFGLRTNRNLSVKVEYDIPNDTLKETGPVTLSVYANTTLLGKELVTSPGRREIRIPAPASSLYADSVNTISIEPDKTWKSPVDGGDYGVILFSAGFVK